MQFVIKKLLPDKTVSMINSHINLIHLEVFPCDVINVVFIVLFHIPRNFIHSVSCAIKNILLQWILSKIPVYYLVLSFLSPRHDELLCSCIFLYLSVIIKYEPGLESTKKRNLCGRQSNFSHMNKYS